MDNARVLAALDALRDALVSDDEIIDRLATSTPQPAPAATTPHAGDVPSVSVDTLDMRLDARAGGLVLGSHGVDLLVVRGSVAQLRSKVEQGMGMAIPAGL